MTPKKAKKFLLGLASDWQELFGLADWTIAFVWHTRPYEDGEQALHPLMTTTCAWPYKWARVQVYLPLATERTKRDLERSFFHECGHVLCSVFPRRTSDDGVEVAGREEERFCEDFGQMVQRIGKHCYEKGLAAGKAEIIREQPRDYEPTEIGVQMNAV